MKIGRHAEDLLREILPLPRAERRRARRDIAGTLGVSESQLYRSERRLGLAEQRTARKDRGQRRIEIAEDIDLFMRGLTVDADLSADHAIFITARHFGLPADFMSATTYNSWLRQERMSRALVKKDLRPYRSFEATAANVLHHYDTTVAEAFYANDDGSIGHETTAQRYKNKPGNKRPRLILYSLIDDHSRVLFARFYFSENSLNLLDFIFRAWSQKDDKRFPFFGIPQFFYCDEGAPAKSGKFKKAEEKLGFKRVNTTPSAWDDFGSRKHGKQERTFGEGLLGEFMKITRIYRFTNIEELNACLYDWLIHINNRRHSVTGQVRFERWLKSVGTPRSMPSEEMFKLLHYERAERRVSKNLQIQLNGKIFQLPYRKPFINWVEARVEVYWYPGTEDLISVVYDHREEEVRAMAPVVDIALDYKSVAKTDREEKLEKVKGRNYAAVNLPDIYKAEKDLPYIPRKSEEFDETRMASKTVETATGGRRPSLATERWFNFYEAVRECRLRDFFPDDRSLSDGDKAWLKDIFARSGKDFPVEPANPDGEMTVKLSETSLVEAIESSRETRRAANSDDDRA